MAYIKRETQHEKSERSIREWKENGMPHDVLRCPNCHAPLEGYNLIVVLWNRENKKHAYQLKCLHCNWGQIVPFTCSFLFDKKKSVWLSEENHQKLLDMR